MKRGAVVGLRVGGALVFLGVGVIFGVRYGADSAPQETQRDKLRALCRDPMSPFRGATDEQCFTEAATHWGKSEYCEELEEEPGKPNELRAKCRSKTATVLGDLELCKQAGTPQATNDCLAELAKSREDVALCKLVTEARKLTVCVDEVATATLQPQICTNLVAPEDRDECISTVVRAGGDGAACEGIAEPAQRATCFGAGAKRGDPNLCLKLPPETRPPCWEAAETTIDDLSSACSGSANCLSQLKFYGVAPCTLISDAQAFLRAGCFRAALEALKSHGAHYRVRESVCSKLQSTALQDECFSALGQLSRRGDACLKVGSKELRRTCLMNAGKTQPRYCRSLEKPEDIKLCVGLASFSTTLDASICQLLDPARRAGCEQEVEFSLRREVERAR